MNAQTGTSDGTVGHAEAVAASEAGPIAEPGDAAPARPPIETVRLTEAQARARRTRSLALAFVLAGLAVLFFVATLDKFGSNLTAVESMRDL